MHSNLFALDNPKEDNNDVSKALDIFDLNLDGMLDEGEIIPVRNLYGEIPEFLESYVFIANKKTAMKAIDANKNKVLDGDEVEKAVKWVQDNPGIKSGRGNGFRGPGRGGRPFGGRESESSNNQTSQPNRVRVTEGSVKKFPTKSLYDTSILRTFFLTIDVDDWEKHMTSLKGTDLDVGAKLVVDDKEFKNVGLRFRGNSSFSRIGSGKKKSFNISIDASNKEARLYGYKTLDLLNAHTDASFLRQAVFNKIANHYLPSPKTNFVHLIINGESWGIYVNVQQYNKDFLSEHWDDTDGIRFKVPANPRGGRALTYLGDDIEAYRSHYEIKTKDNQESWKLFVQSLKKFSAAAKRGDFHLADQYVDIDMCLWYLALENLFIDNDGYWVRASDFNIYVDSNGRIYPILRDANETFRQPGGPGFRQDNSHSGRFGISPYHGKDDQNKILAHILFGDESLRARYAAHYRTLANEWLIWENLKPIVDDYHNLIAPIVKTDVSKLYGYEAFKSSIAGISAANLESGPFGSNNVSFKEFTDERSIYLLNFPELDHLKITPKEIRISQNNKSLAKKSPLSGDEPVSFNIELPTPTKVDSVWIYHSGTFRNSFDKKRMTKSSNNTFTASLVPPKNEKLFYYFEIDSIASSGITNFYPAHASMKPLEKKITHNENRHTLPEGLVISEVMPKNESTETNLAGRYADWFIIENKSDFEISLEGFYMSDNSKKPKKWSFPNGLKIGSHQRLKIWADDKVSINNEIHCSFKLSSEGETLFLVAPDILGNKVIDSITWKDAAPDFLITSN